jgi:hypothetical protein
LSLKDCSLIEVAAQASASLEQAGIQVAVVGGSAVTAYAPDIYTSHDVDFAAINGTTRRAFGAAVAQLGFKAEGRDFVHPASRYSLDLVADTPYIDQRPITKFAIIGTRFGSVRVYLFEDAIADRVAAFLHWGDSESLDVGERAVHARAQSINWRSLQRALKALDGTDAEAARRLELATARLRSAFARGDVRRSR